ncbi:uncharacterized protein BJ171DRAFT_489503 [Polychytrium aggregatum]|uniref:uncharacterized protein n=1 Tax=Polychytrium aggregatum TaxID=110093 RepID=UPI0022FE3D20|nr:uncharacterized protein BJ171DRAFT_489503 [Polychytrium aggregatum]KAI9208604.1 hypothetical protein BJ171DRAFT_489503 [Polychytrium aggregatum]
MTLDLSKVSDPSVQFLATGRGAAGLAANRPLPSPVPGSPLLLPVGTSLVLSTGNGTTNLGSNLSKLKGSRNELLHNLTEAIHTGSYALVGRTNETPAVVIGHWNQWSSWSNDEEPADIDLSVKLFFAKDATPQDVREACQYYKFLVSPSSSIDSLFVQFDTGKYDEESSDQVQSPDSATDLSAPSSSQLGELWRALETCIRDRDVKSVGVAGLNKPQLESFLQTTTDVLPSAVQVNISSSPQDIDDLIEYAESQGLSVYAHRDSLEFLPNTHLFKLLSSHGVIASDVGSIHVGWVIKCSAFDHTRGVLLNKGYLVGAKAC